jgi:hypothetical protein
VEIRPAVDPEGRRYLGEDEESSEGP